MTIDLYGASSTAAAAGGDKKSGDKKSGDGPSQATQLVELAEDRYWFATSMEGEPFAVPHDGARVARVLRGGRESLRAELAAAYAAEHDRAASASALADALLVCEGRAQNAKALTLGLRAVHDDGQVVIDLGDSDGRAVVVTPSGWQVVDRSPVLFRRTELTGELPTPAGDGDLEELAGLLNIDDRSWPLLVAWLAAALLDLPHPIVALTGEQGTGKSTAARLLTELVDPSPAPLRTAPRDPEGWAVAASGSRVVGIDNVSRIKEWLGDCLCRAVTGDGLVRRRLYSDAGLSVLSFRRVVILTSIDPGALRGDLADRLLLVELDRIEPNRRRLDAALDAAFRRAHPRLFGALLDLVAQVLQVLPDVRLDQLPRMADFARVVAAVDWVRGTTALDWYLGETDRLAEQVVEGDPVAAALRALAHQRGSWSGTAGELLAALDGDGTDDAKRPREWPTTGQGMAAAVRRSAPALRSVGVAVDYDRDARPRIWTLTREGTQTGDGSDGSDETASSGPERPDSPVTSPVTFAEADGPSDGPSDGSDGPSDGSDGPSDGLNGPLGASSGRSVTSVTSVSLSRTPSGRCGICRAPVEDGHPECAVCTAYARSGGTA